MRVMVTGATTPLGAALVEALLATKQVEVILALGLDDKPVREHADVMYRQLDPTRPRVLRDIVWSEARDLAIDVVVHGVSQRSTADKGKKTRSSHVDTARELIFACKSHPTIQRLVYRSFADVYSLQNTATRLLDENAPLEFDPKVPQWLRDRVEADLIMCAHIGGPLQIAVVRCADIVAPDVGSQLWDYLQSRVCLRPLGFDPILNVLALEDAAYALALAARSKAVGVFNIPGRDTLPLSRAIARSHRTDVPVPASLMLPLHGLRRWFARFDLRYDRRVQAFHFGGVLDGSRAARELDFVPTTGVHWPMSWWRELFSRLEKASP